jgi:RHS repeat-associated protein
MTDEPAPPPKPAIGPSAGAAPLATSLPEAPTVALPKGGGAVRGLDEEVTVTAARGSAHLSLAVGASPGRHGFGPSLTLAYDSGAGNGAFGIGWSLGGASVSRRTDHGVPRYIDGDASDDFVLTGGETVVPVLEDPGDGVVRSVPKPVADDGASFLVRRYRPRLEGGWARIEQWTPAGGGVAHWRVWSPDGTLSIFGRDPAARVRDPAAPERVFEWLLEEQRDTVGNVIRYEYKHEDETGIDPSLPQERNRLAGPGFAQRYLKRVQYGNRAPGVAGDWLFELVLDYGEHDAETPTPAEAEPWPVRADPFSTCRAGFEVRTYRLCRRILMFHHFAELGPGATIVRSTELAFDENPFATKLVGVTRTGWKQTKGSWSKRSLPPVEFGYEPFALDETVHSLDAASLEGLPLGVDGAHCRWIDLKGEGALGILTEEDGAWFFKRNLGGGTFAPPELVGSVPTARTAQETVPLRRQLVDITGDGLVDLVELDGGSGLYSLDEDGAWQPFEAFAQMPVVSWADPTLRLLDLDGDGRPDLLLCEDGTYAFHRSRGSDGFEEAVRTPSASDEERGPVPLVLEDRQSLFLADMTGDGLPDLIRVRDGETCFWQCYGRGRFGAKVTMDDAPTPAGGNGDFDGRRVRLADADGSGPADLLYIGDEGTITLWRNRSGNGWDDAVRLDVLPLGVDEARVTVLDALATGTAAIVWSSPYPADAQRTKFVDLCGGRKPHLLTTMRNNLGHETTLTYAPSTTFALADRAAGTPWVTRLPFPVFVVTGVESRDRVSGTRFASSYTYHHGHYDGVEREFRGFGRVEQLDTEDYDTFVLEGSSNVVDRPLHQAPVLTKAWFHTGALPDRPGAAERFESEYRRGPQEVPLEQPAPPAGIDAGEWRESLRALAGLALRTEVYALDGNTAEEEPYVVTESTGQVGLVQRRGRNRYASFQVTPVETISYHLERQPADPRIAHDLVLETDDRGLPTRVASVVYGRSAVDGTLPAEILDAQATTHIADSATRYTNDVDTDADYRLRVPYEQTVQEVIGVTPAGNVFKRDELETSIDAAATIAFEASPSGAAESRLLARGRTYFLADDLSGPLALGTQGTRGIASHSHTLALTAGLVTDVFGARVDNAMLSDAGYVHSEGDTDWWLPSGTASYAVDAPAHFYTPDSFLDAYGNPTHLQRDGYDLLVTQVEDATHSRITAENDYRILGPTLVTDANLNRTQIEVDELGVVVASVALGKAGAGEGDTLADPTATFDYDYDRWRLAGLPAVVHSRHRERHRDPTSRWQESYAYMDGRGRVLLTKAQAEPGPARQLQPDGSIVEIDTTPALRWLGNGRTILNNKGNPVKQFESYFSVTHEFESEAALVETGVTPLLYYDPLGRCTHTELPDGTHMRVEFDPWRQQTFDPIDAVLDSAWYAQRGSPDPSGAEPSSPETRAAWLAARSADTPATVHLDSLGRIVYAVADNGSRGAYGTRSEVDLGGTTTRIFDAKGRQACEVQRNAAGALCRERSMEKGERLLLVDVTGNPLRIWDGADRAFRLEYDALRRATAMYSDTGAGEVLVNFQAFGEVHPNAQDRNLRGRIYRIYDQAGEVELGRFDFKGNVLEQSRRFASTYDATIDWSPLAGAGSVAALDAAAAPLLEAETFLSGASYDALDRPVSATLADGTQLVPSYTGGGLLGAMTASLAGGAATTYVASRTYDEKRRPAQTKLGNGTTATMTYDPLTFRLARRRVVRDRDGAVLQDLSYVYDPLGHPVEVRDAAQQTIFFANSVSSPRWTYELDAVYRLVRATGREQAIGNGSMRGPEDVVPNTLPHPNDAAAVRPYVETYEYDETGNVEYLRHAAAGTTTTRWYAYEAATNRLTATSLPGDPDTGPYTATYGRDQRGNMTSMPHLASLDWNEFDQLKSVDLGGGGTAHYVYGAGGGRLRKVVERTPSVVHERLYVGSLEIYRERVNGVVRLERRTVHIGDAGGRVAQADTKTVDAADNTDLNVPLVRYEYGNGLGSASLELDPGGAVLTYEEYHPYGTTAYRSGRSAAEVGLKRYRYIGRERDDDTGLYACGVRWYIPWLGRWTNADPGGFVDGINQFVYARDNPVTFHDPSGYQPPATQQQNPPQHQERRRLPGRFTGHETPEFLRQWLAARGWTYSGTPEWNPEKHVWDVGTLIPLAPPGGATTGGGPAVTTPPAPPPSSTPPLPQRGQVGSVAPYSRQPPATYGPDGSRTSENEHGMPGAELRDMTRNPKTGVSDYGDRQYRNDATLRWERSAALEKTSGGPNSDNPTTQALRDRVANGGSINYREDIFERSRQETIRAAQATGSQVTEENINRAFLEQEGNLFGTVPLNQVMSRLPEQSFGDRISEGIRNAMASETGQAVLGTAGQFARTFLPGFVETEAAVLAGGALLYTTGAVVLHPMLGSVAAAATTAAAATATVVYASAAAGYFIGGRIGHAVTDATGSEAAGALAGAASGAAMGAAIGFAIGSVVPILGNGVGLAIGAVVGGIAGLIGSLW